MAQAKCVYSYLLEVPAGHRCGEHAHDCTEIVFCQKTVGTLRQAGEAYRYHDGTIFVYQPGGTHWVENETAGRHMCIGVVGSGAEQVPAGMWHDCATGQRLFRQLMALLGQPGRFQAQKLDLLAGLVVLELRELAPSATWESRAYARQARAIIDAALHEPMDVAGLARQVFISPDYLRQLFRQEYSESVIQYLIRRRVERAAELLRATRDPVHRIAEECGFNDRYYFSRIFKKVMGQTPGEYRSGPR